MFLGTPTLPLCRFTFNSCCLEFRILIFRDFVNSVFRKSGILKFGIFKKFGILINRDFDPIPFRTYSYTFWFRKFKLFCFWNLWLSIFQFFYFWDLGRTPMRADFQFFNFSIFGNLARTPPLYVLNYDLSTFLYV